MWSCPQCREDVDDGFDVCWSCGTDRDGNPDPEFGTADVSVREPTGVEAWNPERLRSTPSVISDAASDQGPAVAAGERRPRISLGCLFAWCILIAGAMVFGRAMNDAREAMRQSACRGRLNYLSRALQMYHEGYGCFPPAYVPDEDGKPMHSWRVLLLPCLNETAVYQEYDFNEPWNGPNNRQLADRITNDIFHCSSGPHVGDSPLTDYVVIVGAETAFPGSKSTSLADMLDGPENTILLVEIKNSNIHWMEPRDLTADEMSYVVDDPNRPSISSPHPSGPGVVFADPMWAYRLRASLRPQTVRALTTPAGGEQVSKHELADGFFLAE